jgi:hypothetical protein
VKVALHANFFGVVTNSETLERYRDHATFSETEDLVDGTVTVSGASYHLIHGGAGQVYAEVGHKISMGFEGDLNFEILFQAGQTDYVDDGLDGRCSALARRYSAASCWRSRIRAVMPSMILMATSGSLRSIMRNADRFSRIVSRVVSATIEADRGWPSISESSPK